MARLFISHSSRDNVVAIAFKQWLGAKGWADEDVFLDLDDLGAGERWKEALHKANARLRRACSGGPGLKGEYSLARLPHKTQQPI